MTGDRALAQTISEEIDAFAHLCIWHLLLGRSVAPGMTSRPSALVALLLAPPGASGPPAGLPDESCALPLGACP